MKGNCVCFYLSSTCEKRATQPPFFACQVMEKDKIIKFRKYVNKELYSH